MRFTSKLLSSVLIIQAAFSYPVLANDHQWVRVATDRDDNTYYLDKLVASRGKFRRYWRGVLLNLPNSAIWEETLYSIDCESNQQRARIKVMYGKNNKFVARYNYGGNGYLEKVVPTSPQGKVAAAACALK